MHEPITAVWGVYNRARELVMLKPYDCTDNGWPEGYTVERLPLATPEMVEFINAARGFVQAQRESGFGTNAMMPHWHRLEAAERAAGGAHGA